MFCSISLLLQTIKRIFVFLLLFFILRIFSALPRSILPSDFLSVSFFQLRSFRFVHSASFFHCFLHLQHPLTELQIVKKQLLNQNSRPSLSRPSTPLFKRNETGDRQQRRNVLFEHHTTFPFFSRLSLAQKRSLPSAVPTFFHLFTRKFSTSCCNCTASNAVTRFASSLISASSAVISFLISLSFFAKKVQSLVNFDFQRYIIHCRNIDHRIIHSIAYRHTPFPLQPLDHRQNDKRPGLQRLQELRLALARCSQHAPQQEDQASLGDCE